jgi:hypothetical protein
MIVFTSQESLRASWFSSICDAAAIREFQLYSVEETGVQK